MMESSGLKRKMSFWHVWAIGVGSVVGDGIFYLVGEGAAVAGPIAPFSYLFAGLVMMLIMLAMCEMPVGMPSAGSIHLWSRRIQGPGFGTIAGLSYTLMNITFLGSVSIANGIVSNYFFQFTENAALSAAIWAILLLTLVAFISLSGAALAGRTQLILVALLTSAMLIFGISGVVSGRIDPGNYSPFSPFGFSGFMAATGLGLYAYMGPLASLTASGEVKDPRVLPKAMFWAFITFLVLYTGSMIVMLGLVNFTEFASLESPFTYAASRVWGGYAGLIMNMAAWVAAFTCLVGEMFASSRLLYGMAAEGALPQIFTRLTKNTKVPYVTIFLSLGVAVFLVIMANTGALSSAYVTISMTGTGMGIVCWLISLASAAKYKSRFPKEWSSLSWKLPEKPRAAIFTIAFIGILATFYMVFSSDPKAILYVIICTAIMLAFYKIYSKPRMKYGMEFEEVSEIHKG
jgi:amino acid transporter